MRAAHPLDRLRELVARRARVDCGLGGEGEQQVLGRDVLVAHAARLVVGGLEQADQILAERGSAGLARHGRKGVERLVREPADALGVGPRAAKHGDDDAAVLLEQRDEEVAAELTSGLWRAPASRCAAASASWDLTVNRSACIENLSQCIAGLGERLARLHAPRPAFEDARDGLVDRCQNRGAQLEIARQALQREGACLEHAGEPIELALEAAEAVTTRSPPR